MTKGERSAPAGDGSTGTRIRSRGDGSALERPVKWRRVLGEFYRGRSLNRFEAEGIGEHVLHTTVATLQSKGVMILRHNESVRGYQGCETTVCRYQIDRQPANMERARVLLGEAAGPQGAQVASRSRDPAGDVGQHSRAPDRARGGP